MIDRLKLSQVETLLTLKNLNWLNDEVINFYYALISDRAANDPKLPKSWYELSMTAI